MSERRQGKVEVANGTCWYPCQHPKFAAMSDNPDDTEGRCAVPVNRDPKTGPSWSWDGNGAAPTLSPSLDCKGYHWDEAAQSKVPCGWHGFIRQGRME